MDARGYVGANKVSGKFGIPNARKKFTAPTFVDKAKQRNFRQFNQDDHSVGVKKPYRMNSVNKPSRGFSNNLNYGVSGMNYVKKKEHEKFEQELEEAKALAKYPEGYVSGGAKLAYVGKADWDNDSASNDGQYEASIKILTQKVEELENKLKARDAEIKRIKTHNLKLMNEKSLMETKLKKMIREDKQKELDRRAQEEQEEDQESDNEQPRSNEDMQRRLFQMLMQAQSYESRMQRELEEQREKEMIEKAIQESLKENPNPDVMNYEQLQELEERIGSVSKGFTDMEISMIPTKMCTSTKEDCSICLEPIKVSELVKALSCNHEFHKDCIDQCLKSTKKCPCCMHEHEMLY